MQERIVNLDSSPRSSVTIEIGGYSYCIKRVVIGVRRLWQQFVQESIEKLEKIRELDEALKAFRSVEDEKEAAELRKRVEDITREVDAFSKEKIDQLLEIIGILLSSNGHEFDRAWWEQNADETDYRNFIIAVMEKDQEKEGTKKNEVAEARSDGNE